MAARQQAAIADAEIQVENEVLSQMEKEAEVASKSSRRSGGSARTTQSATAPKDALSTHRGARSGSAAYSGAAPRRPASGDLVINATSMGMSEADPLPLDPDLIDASMTVAEVVAKPEVTRLLSEAQTRGAAIHSGLHMIHHQVDLIARHMLALYGPKT